MSIPTDRPYLVRAWTGLAWWWIVGTPDPHPESCGWQTAEYRTWRDGMDAIALWWQLERDHRQASTKGWKLVSGG